MYLGAGDGSGPFEKQGKIYSLSAGDQGIRETVSVMQKLARDADRYPEVKAVAMDAVEDCRPTDTLCYLKKIFDYARARILYVPDIQGVEEITAPWIHSRRILTSGKTYGDCDDFSVCEAAWLRAVGVRTRFTVVATPKNNGSFDHVRLEAFHLNRWIPLESTMPTATLGSKMPFIREQHFEV